MTVGNRGLSRAAVAVLVAAAGLAPGLGGPAQADSDDAGGTLTDDGTFRIADSVGQAVGGQAGHYGDGGGGGSGEICWFRVDGDGGIEVMEHVFERAEAEPPDDGSVPFRNRCLEPVHVPNGTSWMWHPEGISVLYDPSHYVFWGGGDVTPGTPLDVPLLEEAWAVIEGQLGGPEPVVTPPLGVPLVVDHHTFVAVDNPQSEVFEENCMPAADLCVTMRAEPTLRFDPGDGSDVIECDPAGTRFDAEDDRSPAEQAEGGCAHAYSERSAAGFPGRVEVAWEVEWSSTGHGGIGGVFDPLVLPGDDAPNAERVVDEAQAVVNEIETGGQE